MPVTIEVEVPFDLHRYIIGQKGSGIRKMMDEFEVDSVHWVLYHVMGTVNLEKSPWLSGANVLHQCILALPPLLCPLNH